jgi:hypothetical protein
VAPIVQSEWNGDAVKAAIKAELAKRIQAAALIVLGRARELLSTAGTLTAGEVSRRARTDAQFRKQFNRRNYAYRLLKGEEQYLKVTAKGTFRAYKPSWGWKKKA